MKKLLLSLACLLGITALHAEVTFEVKSFTDAKGEFLETQSASAASRWQPLESFKLGDYTFSVSKANGSTEPALYGSTPNSGKDEWTLRIYQNNTMTVTAPAGTTMKKVVFSDGSNGTANAAHTVDTGALSDITASGMTWTGNAGAFTITAAKNFRFAKVTIYTTDDADPEPEPEPDRAVVTSIAAAKALVPADAANGDKFLYKMDFAPIVVYSSGSYVYVTDGTDYALLYKAGLGVEPGDKIAAGSEGYACAYNKLIEFVPDAVEVESKGNAVPSPVVIAPDDITSELVAANQDNYITINNVVFDEGGVTAGYVVLGDEQIPVNVYNRFGLPPVKAGTFNVSGFISVYNTTVQINYTAMDVVGDEPEPQPLEGEGEGTEESPYNVERALSVVATSQQTGDPVYIEGIIIDITEISLSYGNATYTIADEADAEAGLKVFRGYSLAGEKFTAEDEIKVGDRVVIQGKLTDYRGEAQVTNSMIIELETTDTPVYTAEAIVAEDKEWTSDTFLPVMVGTELTVEVYEGEEGEDNVIVLRSWLGDEGYDLAVTYDADENVTSVTPMVNGEPTETFDAGDYASFATGSKSYYYVQLCLDDGYSYAGSDNETQEGYVAISGYFYKTQNDYVWGYYNCVWPKSAGVESVKVDNNNAPAVYYNLQGVRVENPANGLYIKSQGDKAVKVLVK